MTKKNKVQSFSEVEFGEELPELKPDISMEMIRRFGAVSGMTYWRFTDHEKSREAGLPGAIVPGILSQGILVSMIHRWAPECIIHKIDTIFRAPVVVDSDPICRGTVTDLDDEKGYVEIDLTICNEAGETRVLGTATVELPA